MLDSEQLRQVGSALQLLQLLQPLQVQHLLLQHLLVVAGLQVVNEGSFLGVGHHQR